MAKITIKNRYATVPNDLLNSDKISLKAKGLYAFIQSKPDTWDFSVDRISKQIFEGTTVVASALRELESFGYLRRKRFQNASGFWLVEYELNEFGNPDVENPRQENLVSGNPSQENPVSGKPANISKQDYSKKDINKTIIVKSNRDLLFEKWLAYKKEKKQTYTQTGIKSLYEKWAKFTDEELALIIEQSISNNWAGLFELKNNVKNSAPMKGKIQSAYENISIAGNNIIKQIEDGTYVNPFATGNK